MEKTGKWIYEGLIHWFPGHMAKAVKEMKEKLPFIHTILEVRDARIPISSGSPELEKLIEKKHRIVVFNKADLADPSSQTWVLDHLKQKGLKGVYISAHKNSVNEMKKLIPLILEESGKMKKTQENNVMIVGIPNVGKSTIINAIRITTKKGGRVAKTGAVPGVTRGVTGFRLTDPSTTSSSTYILDTPGAMSPKFEKDDNDRAIKYAATGAIQDSVLELDVVAEYILHFMNDNKHYKYMELFGLNEPTYETDKLIEHIATKRNMKLRGDKLNIDAATRLFLSMYRKGDFGRMTLDTPEDIPSSSRTTKSTHIHDHYAV